MVRTDIGVEERRGVIFIEDFIDVPLSLGTIQGRFARADEWLTTMASAAEEDGETLRLRIGPSWVGGRVSREVAVTLGPQRERGNARVVPLVWGATELPTMFPVLSGDLELAPLDARQCRLTLTASYLPPFGDFGRALDRALLHRVSQSTVRSFLTRVANNLEEGGGSEPVSSPVR